MKYYLKFLGLDRQPCHGGIGQWPEPGEWTETIENPIPCKSGYHLCRKQDIFRWCVAPTLWVVEAEGVVTAYDKVVASRARLIRQVDEWNEKNQRLFAADCAEHVLHHFESKYPNDKRPRVAIETVRKFAIGQATAEELEAAAAAAWSATWLASGSAAKAASGSAAKAASDSAANSAAGFVVSQTTAAAAHSAEAFAVGDTWTASYISVSAAGSAGVSRLTERQWQITHLLTKYLNLNSEECSNEILL